MVPLCLLANEFRAAKRVEGIVRCAVSSQELLVWRALHSLALVELYLPIVNSVASLTLVSHRIGIGHVDSRAITHETIHCFVSHFCLIKSSERSNLHLGHILRATAQPKRRSGRVPYIPEIVSRLLGPHVDARGVFILREVQLFVKPNQKQGIISQKMSQLQ